MHVAKSFFCPLCVAVLKALTIFIVNTVLPPNFWNVVSRISLIHRLCKSNSVHTHSYFLQPGTTLTCSSITSSSSLLLSNKLNFPVRCPLSLLTLAYVNVYITISNFLTVYINQHEFFLMSFFESFVACNFLKIGCVASDNMFSVTLRSFILIAIYVAMRFKNKTFFHATQKHFSSFHY